MRPAPLTRFGTRIELCIAAAFWPKPVIVRLSDFKSNEYRKLIGGSRYEPEEENPMLGFRGCRLGLLFPEVTRMQCRAIFEAACLVQGEKKKTELEIMVPLVSLSEELHQQREVIDEVARQVMGEYGMTIEYHGP